MNATRPSVLKALPKTCKSQDGNENLLFLRRESEHRTIVRPHVCHTERCRYGLTTLAFSQSTTRGINRVRWLIRHLEAQSQLHIWSQTHSLDLTLVEEVRFCPEVLITQERPLLSRASAKTLFYTHLPKRFGMETGALCRCCEDTASRSKRRKFTRRYKKKVEILHVDIYTAFQGAARILLVKHICNLPSAIRRRSALRSMIQNTSLGCKH